MQCHKYHKHNLFYVAGGDSHDGKRSQLPVNISDIDEFANALPAFEIEILWGRWICKCLHCFCLYDGNFWEGEKEGDSPDETLTHTYIQIRVHANYYAVRWLKYMLFVFFFQKTAGEMMNGGGNLTTSVT